MRAKMRLATITRMESSELLEFSAVAAKSYNPDGADEDNTFAKFSPSATLKIMVANPALIGKFTPGETYYVDFTPVDGNTSNQPLQP